MTLCHVSYEPLWQALAAKAAAKADQPPVKRVVARPKRGKYRRGTRTHCCNGHERAGNIGANGRCKVCDAARARRKYSERTGAFLHEKVTHRP